MISKVGIEISFCFKESFENFVPNFFYLWNYNMFQVANLVEHILWNLPFVFKKKLMLIICLSGLLCDLLWSDPDKDVQGWGENDRGNILLSTSIIKSYRVFVCFFVSVCVLFVDVSKDLINPQTDMVLLYYSEAYHRSREGL